MRTAFLFIGLIASAASAQESATKSGADAEKKGHPMAGLRLRPLGPAVMAGRVVGFAVHPEHRGQYFVAVASGGVWKTENAGVSWRPVFDNEGSYSIGCVVMDPKTPN